MKIATLQFAPKLGDTQGNIQRADELLSKGGGRGSGIEGLKPDVLVLSEMALTGYNFPSLTAIKPYLEPAGQGPCGRWARETAQRLRCKVCVGYPEIEREEGTGSEKYYNALLVVDENGEVLVNYRKTFLYYTDETWAAEGDAERGFKQLPFSSSSLLGDGSVGGGDASKTIATTFGICMDINPYRFEAPFTAWEFANRILDSRSQLVILSMAWLTHKDREQLNALGKKPDSDTFNYWIVRLMPLFRRHMQNDGGNPDGEKRVTVVFSNRVGEEEGHGNDDGDGVRYAGTSAILAFSQRPSSSPSSPIRTGDEDEDEDGDGEGSDLDVKVLCWDLMGATEEGICFADTASDPKLAFTLARAGE